MHSPYSQPSLRRLGPLRNIVFRKAYPGTADSVPAARKHLAEVARLSGLDCDTADAALVCLSELATNAVTHAIGNRPRPRFIVNVFVRGTRQRCLRLEVYDPDGERCPVFPPGKDAARLLGLDPDCLSGRGLAMVASMADRTGVETNEGLRGKTVWCELSLARHDNGGRPCEQETATVTTPGVVSA